ncbi:hypothetical protein HMPREF3036_01997 [Sutterella sp. KLE1602]|nr:hypothetical protein HMPREF3036_01997 [Sutterella sp. KLE1602]
MLLQLPQEPQILCSVRSGGDASKKAAALSSFETPESMVCLKLRALYTRYLPSPGIRSCGDTMI